MAAVRMRYRILAKHEEWKPNQRVLPGGMMTVEMTTRYFLNMDGTDLEAEKRLHDMVEVGKEYFADFFPVEELTDWDKPAAEEPHGEGGA